jgi:hypothetical protein
VQFSTSNTVEEMDEGVLVRVGVLEGVRVGVGVFVAATWVAVAVGVFDGVNVFVGVEVAGTGVGVGVNVGVLVGVGVGVPAARVVSMMNAPARGQVVFGARSPSPSLVSVCVPVEPR